MLGVPLAYRAIRPNPEKLVNSVTAPPSTIVVWALSGWTVTVKERERLSVPLRNRLEIRASNPEKPEPVNVSSGKLRSTG